APATHRRGCGEASPEVAKGHLQDGRARPGAGRLPPHPTAAPVPAGCVARLDSPRACADAGMFPAMPWKLRPYRRKDPKTGQLRENGWEVDIVLKLPDGKVLREHVRAPVSSRSGAKYWAEQREAELLRNGRKKEEPPVPTLDEFFPRFI